MRRFPMRLARPGRFLLYVLLGILGAAYLASFAAHAAMVLAYPYPLDYGEGPLLAQIARLRAGTPIWQLYADTAAPPYLVVNYPPFYLLVVAALSVLTGDGLFAGRLVSLLATLGCVAALALLAQPARPQGARHRLAAWLLALLFLSIPVVREWGVLLRVDMLGVCLGLWGLYYCRLQIVDCRVDPGRSPTSNLQFPILAALLLLLALFTKPSLIAAPAAGCLWLGWRALTGPPEQRAAARRILVLVVATLGLGGAGLLALLQWASGGWFWLHVVTANANRWDYDLARLFWGQQLALRWALALAAIILLLGAWALRRSSATDRHDPTLALAVIYTLFGIVTAVGVGKVGAYANYFLELYAGLVWIIGQQTLDSRQWPANRQLSSVVCRLSSVVLLIVSLLYYPPLWDPLRLRPAGLIEPSPPRLAFGRYGLWHDLRREAEVLTAQRRVQDALLREVRAAGPLLFTDMPGVAAAAGATSRIQIFEQRQLLDQGLWDQRALLLELANGTYPLLVMDYLGNWLSPQMIELITRRYAHDGSRGTFDLYRPVDPGPRRPTDLRFPNGLRLQGYHLAPPLAAAPNAPYDMGEWLVVTLEWAQAADSAAIAPQPPLAVVLRLNDAAGRVIVEDERPLLYGALPPADWPAAQTVQHMQPLALPAKLAPGTYRLSVGLRAGERELAPPQNLTQIDVDFREGLWFEETRYFVPAPFRRAWDDMGGVARAGYPLTPAVPFAWGALQCFERVCLELRDGAVQQRPLGETLYLAETLRHNSCAPLDDSRVRFFGITSIFSVQAPDDYARCPDFLPLWEQFGASGLGAPISGEIPRYGYMVQWTRYARLERRPDSGALGLGRLGDDSLRLPPGVRYRWP